MRAVLGSHCEFPLLCHCKKKKKKTFSCKSYEEPDSRRQKDCRGEQTSTHIVFLSMDGEDNGEERFGSLTPATLASPQVDKVKMDGPN